MSEPNVPSNNLTPPSIPPEDTDDTVSNGSHFFSVSLRGWLALVLVGTLCYMSVRVLKVEEPLSSIVTLTVGFYFGQNTKK